MEGREGEMRERTRKEEGGETEYKGESKSRKKEVDRGLKGRKF